MKILSQPDTKNWSFKCKCDKCEAQLEAEATDIRHTHSERDGVYPASNTYSIQCPVCSHYINVPVASLPKIIQIEAQKRSQRLSSSYFDR